MNSKDFLRLGVPLGEATRRATDFVAKYVLSGGDKSKLDDEVKATRVQKSVFECQVGQKEWASLRDRLLHEIKMDEDSLRFYFLDENAVQRTEHHGVDKPVDLTEPLIL
jgi:CRISPR-associated endonuclease Cas2